MDRWEWYAMVGVLLLAFFLRTTALTTVPPGLRYDELLNYGMAERVLEGEYPIYFPESWGHEPLFHYAQALMMRLGGQNIWSLRIAAPIFGVLAVLTTWLVARRMFGVRIALVSAAALSVSFWSVFFSRYGSRVIAVTPFSCLTVYFLWRGYDRLRAGAGRATSDFALGGVFLGLGIYVYVAARVVPALPVLFAGYVALAHPRYLRPALGGLTVLVLVAAVISSPLLLHLHQNPDAEQRLDQLTGPRQALMEGDPGPLAYLAVRAAGMFFWRGEEDWLYNVYGRPVFDAVMGLCFVLGLALSCRKWRDVRHTLLLLWFGIGVSPSVAVPPAASLSHAIAAQPPAYLLAGLGIDAVWRLAKRVGPKTSLLATLGIIASHGGLSARSYFAIWANAPEVRSLYQAGITAVARQVDDMEPPVPVAVGAPYVNHWNPWNARAFDLTSRRTDLQVRWFNPASAWVWPAGSMPSRLYLPQDPLGPLSIDPQLLALFTSDGDHQVVQDRDFLAYRTSRGEPPIERVGIPGELQAVWPPDLDHLSPPTGPLAFGERFVLLGVETPETPVTAGDTLRIVTYWETQTADENPIVVFAHVTSDGMDIWGQYDGLEVKPDSLQAGDLFAQVLRIPLKAETPEGVYHLQIGLYHPETHIRLPVLVSPEGPADRVWIAELPVENE